MRENEKPKLNSENVNEMWLLLAAKKKQNAE